MRARPPVASRKAERFGPMGEAYSIVAPLVANLTDDDGSGDIDLCDTPDVVVVASMGSGRPTTPS